MPKKKTPDLAPKEQFERFLKTVRTVEADETGKTLEETFKKLSPKKKPTRPAKID